MSKVLNKIAIDHFLRGRKWAFKCEYCNVSFSSQYACEEHQDTKHNIIEQDDDWELL